VTELGIVILAREVQFLKVSDPKLVTELGIVISVREAQS
jgi:hypothetical protein